MLFWLMNKARPPSRALFFYDYVIPNEYTVNELLMIRTIITLKYCWTSENPDRGQTSTALQQGQ